MATKAELTACPFKVGDRVRYKKEIRGSWPEATVTAITERGFRYEYDKPFLLGTRVGSTTGGEAFESAFDCWELAAAPPEPTASEPQLRACRICGEDRTDSACPVCGTESDLCSGCLGMTVHHTCGRAPDVASDSPAQPDSDPMAFTPSDDPNDPYALPKQIKMSSGDFDAFVKALNLVPCSACKGRGYVSADAAPAPTEAAARRAAMLIEVLTSQSKFDRLLPDERYDAIAAIITAELENK